MNTGSNFLGKHTKIFLTIIGVILTLGATMVFSSSYILAKEAHGNGFYYFLKQIVFIGMGLGIALGLSKTKITFWIKYGFYLNLISAFLVLLTFIPGLGVTVKGAHRWINLGLFSFQPGELVRFTLILASVSFFENFDKIEPKERIKQAAGLMMPLFLLLLQPDFGSFSIGFFVLACVCYLSSFSRKYFYTGLGTGILLAIPILISQPYRVKRLLAFLDPWKNAQGSGFQIIQSYLAFANGSIFGQGLGNSNEKLFYLPEAHNDFIFSVIGEELGFVGVGFVVFLFMAFIYFGFKIALKIQHKKTFLVVGSIVFTIGFQALLNMCVVLGLLPTKGLNLPFISAGGSSIIANAFGIGIILSAVKSQQRINNVVNEREQFQSGNTFTSSQPQFQRAENGNLFQKTNSF